MNNTICTFDVWPKYWNIPMIPLNRVTWKRKNRRKKIEGKIMQIICCRSVYKVTDYEFKSLKKDGRKMCHLKLLSFVGCIKTCLLQKLKLLQEDIFLVECVIEHMLRSYRWWFDWVYEQCLVNYGTRHVSESLFFCQIYKMTVKWIGLPRMQF